MKLLEEHHQRILAREKALIEILRAIPAPLLCAIPVPLQKVLERREAINEKQIVAKFAKELRGERHAAVKYEWYYDGRQPAALAAGFYYSECKKPLSYSKTDLPELGKKIGIESNVKLNRPEGEAGELSSGLVLEASHKIYLRTRGIYLHMLAEKSMPQLSQAERLKLPVIYDCYTHLFDLQLYQLLIRACSRIKRRADWVFVGTHERWPILVGAPHGASEAR